MQIKNTHVPRPAATRSSRALAILAALACALIAAAALPSLAAAATFEVNTTLDEPDASSGTGACATAAGKCSLRAAIETSNGNPVIPSNKITFDTTNVFGGAKPASTITLLSELPNILHAVEIVGGECPTALGQGPCVEVDGTGVAGLEGVFNVLASQTTISNLAIEGGKNGVVVGTGRVGFTATGDWFGYELTTGGGNGGGSENAGVYLNREADGATIGGDEEADRNSFGHSEVGVIVRGASNTSIRGNYFGTIEGSLSLTATLEVGIQVGDDSETPTGAEDTRIGGELTTAEAASAACDGPCNVIVTQGGVGIKLHGSVSDHLGAATGPTTILGNYIGLAPLGAASLGFQEVDIEGTPQSGGLSTTGPGEVTIGGEGARRRNYLIGGEATVLTRGAQALRVEGNEIGYSTGHTPSEAPEEVGIGLNSTGVTVPAVIRGNRINAEGANGIENEFVGAEIAGNEIVEPSKGIAVSGADVGAPNAITGNTVIEAGGSGILINNDANKVAGNVITKAGRFGIYVDEAADHNVIGSDAPGAPNTITGTANRGEPDGGAILVNGVSSSLNEIAANVGSGNQGPFIQLTKVENSEPTKPNQGILPPTITTAMQGSASGTAQANATVRLFRKATAEPGELAALITVVQANSSGTWTAKFPPEAVGTLIAATQTSTVGGTSEVSAPKAAEADPAVPVTTPVAAVPIAAPPAGPMAPKAPSVKITKGPKKSSESTTAKFKFTATTAAGVKFECKLDGAKWAKCASPKTYKKLKVGKHTFRVRALASGLTGAAAKYQFEVKS